MVFWRKKNEGFEWHSYVRTTKLIRRQKRRDKLADAREAAVFGVKRAGWLSWTRLSALIVALGHFSVEAGLWCLEKLITFGHSVWQTLQSLTRLAWRAGKQGGTRLGHGLSAGVEAGWVAGRERAKAGAKKARHVAKNNVAPRLAYAAGRSVELLRPVGEKAGRPELALPLMLVAGIALAGSLLQFVLKGLTSSMVFAALIAICAGLLVWFGKATWQRESGWQFPAFLAPPQARMLMRFTAIAATVTGLVAGAVTAAPYLMRAGAGKQIALPDFTLPSIPLTTGGLFEGDVIDGRANVVSGDTLRVKETLVRLSNVSAPMPSQRCRDKRERHWSCGRRARSTLRQIIGRNAVSCSEVQRLDEQQIIGVCKIQDRDIAEELVRKGYGFAETGFFARYREAEAEAKAAGRGIWQGEAEHPEVYRNQLWRTAAEKAPGGCPIKGLKRRGRQLYALPWDAAYRKFPSRKRRGAIWFCSEDDARTAGFERAS